MLSLLSCLCLLAAPEGPPRPIPPARSARWIEEAIAGQHGLPSLAEVLARAEAALGLGSEQEARSWARRARWRGLVPRLTAEVGSDRDRTIKDVLSGTDYTRMGAGIGAELGVRFELGRLVFSEAELKAFKLRMARRAAIRLALDEVTQLYFQRLQVELDRRRADSPDLQLQAAALDGQLAARMAPPGAAADPPPLSTARRWETR